MKIKGAYLKNLTAAPVKSQSPIHTIPPNPSLLLSTIIGFLPVTVQLTTREPWCPAGLPSRGVGTKCPFSAAGNHQISSWAKSVLENLEQEALLSGRSAVNITSLNFLAFTLRL